jgi:hypothetical protein
MNWTTGSFANATDLPWQEPPLFETGHQVAVALVALPVIVVWWLVWRCAPKRRFRATNPYVRMQYLYAMVAGTMVGFLAGHALPNSLLGHAEDIKFLAFFAGIGVTVAFLRFMRSCGRANFQIVASTHQEPYHLFDDETGDQLAYVSTGARRTPAASVFAEQPSSAYASVDSSVEGGVFVDSLSRDSSPRRVAVAHAMGDDMAEDITTAADQSDILWIRRWMALVLFAVYMIYGVTDGVFLVYNYHEQSAAVLVACFWISKIASALTLSGFLIFAYVHLHPHECRCCCRRWVYPVAALVYTLVAVCSCLPVFLSVPSEEIAEWLVPNVAFGAFGAFVAGALMVIAMLFVFFEVPEASARSEFIWWLLFVVAGVVSWVTGRFL